MPVRANPSQRGHDVVTEFANFELHSAAASGNQGLVEYALGRGQPINSVIDGVLPLHAACAGGHEQVVKVLIDHGADVNAPRLPRRYSNEKNKDSSAPIVGTTGSTPLHFAAANGNKNVMMTLLLRGAHPDIHDKHGVTPAVLAEQHGWVECAQLLREWIENKDRDLRERGAGGDEFGQSVSGVGDIWFGNEEDVSGSTRKRIQVKRSIDTALNRLKPSGGLVAPQKSLPGSSSSVNRYPLLTPPTSPTRTRRDRSPSQSEEGQLPDDFDPNRRRPSLPQVLNPNPPTSSPHDHSLRNYKSAHLAKAPRSPRRPRSAGNGAEPDVDANTAKTPTRKLGTKLSLLNLFKKGSDSNGVPLERTPSNQVSGSSSIPISIPSSQGSPSWNVSSLSGSPKQISALESRTPPGPLPRAGYRFGSGDNSIRQHSPSVSSSSLTQASPQNNKSSPHPYSPPRYQAPLAVDLHNALAAQQYQTQSRGRSGSNGSTLGLGIMFDGNEDGGGSVSSSPLNRIAMHRMRPGHVRDRSGSGASNRNIQVFDDEVILPDSSNSKGSSSSRPGILRGHHRTSSTGQTSVLRALRFDSSSSTSSRRDRESGNPPLRGCTSASSLRRVVETSPCRQARSGSPAREPTTPVTATRIPDSAPATVHDFDTSPGGGRTSEDNDEFDDSYYGQPIDRHPFDGVSDAQMRNRGLSFGSSDSSLSPEFSVADEELNATNTLNSEFPFSINQPPPISDDVEGANTSSRLLTIPHDGRGRGDSVSSTSTTDSLNPALSASGTTSASGGSNTITTPLRSPEGSSFLDLESPTSPTYKFSQDSPVDTYSNPGVVNLNERRSRSPLGINMSLAASHARAEQMVQQKKAAILSHNDDLLDVGGSDQVPLSARLAALGESLELERKLREQKHAEETALKTPGSPPKGERLMRDSLDTVTSTNGAGVLRQSSLNTGSSPRKKEPKRPHTSSGTSSPTTPNASLSSSLISHKPDRLRPGHQLSHSTSVVEMSPIPDVSVTGSAKPRSLTPDLTDLDSNLSRMSSLEGLDTDTELGPSLYRVATAPHSSSKSRRERDLASATKLTRMGITPNAPTPPKRFGGLRSLVQTLKGR
ncbi:putative ankyrin-repeat protein [Marasmius tenuissimus]|uniref:Ankyrin-repeat protein n=1 Tax=Marasmius tenuissimus TaxID=585030 RepID=A0ABR3AIA0_9AGAR|nr:putative ankyrin-repeat protein [Marasmius tenuissimus]